MCSRSSVIATPTIIGICEIITTPFRIPDFVYASRVLTSRFELVGQTGVLG
jgi:hypothetical protein